jgi:hypothetical protein
MGVPIPVKWVFSCLYVTFFIKSNQKIVLYDRSAHKGLAALCVASWVVYSRYWIVSNNGELLSWGCQDVQVMDLDVGWGDIVVEHFLLDG